MPELPEVETVRRTLKQLVIGKVIERVDVRLPRIIRKPEEIAEFDLLLRGQTILDVQRRGKYLKFILNDVVLVSHLRMEGRYGVYQSNEAIEDHTHVIFQFTDGTDLRYKDVRQFGTMEIWKKGEEELSPPLSNLGPEPLLPEFTLNFFKERIKGKKTKIKPLLLNQEFIAGLGNIYVDEALYRARIHPETESHTISARKLSQLYQAIRETLGEAVESGGSSIKSYVNGQGEMGMFQLQLKAYGREGEPCEHCGKPLEKMVVGGRGTHYCPRCQRKPRMK
jgi:formamidopyrimidine-DNA glycosylase